MRWNTGRAKGNYIEHDLSVDAVASGFNGNSYMGTSTHVRGIGMDRVHRVT
jgi:hypothetical protein